MHVNLQAGEAGQKQEFKQQSVVERVRSKVKVKVAGEGRRGQY